MSISWAEVLCTVFLLLGYLVNLKSQTALYSINQFIVQDVEGGTALMAAARQGDAAAVRRLLGEGADPEERDSEGCTAMHWAADKGRVEVIKELLAAGADIDARDNDGNTPLHYAALAEQRTAAIGLLFGGADVAAVNQDGETPEEVAPPAWAETVFRKQSLF